MAVYAPVHILERWCWQGGIYEADIYAGVQDPVADWFNL